jgi:hypothetical protein
MKRVKVKNWKELDGEFEDTWYEKLWSFADDKLSFNPYNENQEFIITPPPPCKSFDTSSFFGDNYSQELCDNLEVCMNEWFKIISKGRRMYALEWQSTTYSFDPNLPFERDKFNEWLIPAFPAGELFCFLNDELTDGVFGDGWNGRIIIWGDNLLKAFETIKPKMLLKARVIYSIEKK